MRFSKSNASLFQIDCKDLQNALLRFRTFSTNTPCAIEEGRWDELPLPSQISRMVSKHSTLLEG